MDFDSILSNIIHSADLPKGATPPGPQQPATTSPGPAVQPSRGLWGKTSSPIPAGANPNVADDYLARLTNEQAGAQAPEQFYDPASGAPMAGAATADDMRPAPQAAPNPMGADLQEATRKAIMQNRKHYGDDVIVNRLALERPDLRPGIQDALKNGYSSTEVLDFYAPPTTGQRVKENLSAGLRAAGNAFGANYLRAGVRSATGDEGFQEALGDERATQSALTRAHPEAAFTGGMAGIALPGAAGTKIAGAGLKAVTGAKELGLAGQLASEAAGFGAASAGAAADVTSDPHEILKAGLEGGAFAGAAGLGLRIPAQAIATVARRLETSGMGFDSTSARMAAEQLANAGVVDEHGNIVSNPGEITARQRAAAADRMAANLKTNPPEVPGVQRTTAQQLTASGDVSAPVVGAMEDSARTGGSGAQFLNRDRANMEVLAGHVQDVGAKPGEPTIGDLEDARRSTANAQYAQARIEPRMNITPETAPPMNAPKEMVQSVKGELAAGVDVTQDAANKITTEMQRLQNLAKRTPDEQAALDQGTQLGLAGKTPDEVAQTLRDMAGRVEPKVNLDDTTQAVNDAEDAIRNSPLSQVKTAVKQADQATAADVQAKRIDLSTPEGRVAQLQNIKEALDAEIASAKTAQNNQLVRRLQAHQEELVNAMREASPEFAAANDEFAQRSRDIDQRKAAESAAEKSMSGDDVKLTKLRKALDDSDRAKDSPNRRDRAKVLSPEDEAAMRKALAELENTNKTRETGSTGSQTARRLLAPTEEGSYEGLARMAKLIPGEAGEMLARSVEALEGSSKVRSEATRAEMHAERERLLQHPEGAAESLNKLGNPESPRIVATARGIQEGATVARKAGQAAAANAATPTGHEALAGSERHGHGTGEGGPGEGSMGGTGAEADPLVALWNQAHNADAVQQAARAEAMHTANPAYNPVRYDNGSLLAIGNEANAGPAAANDILAKALANRSTAAEAGQMSASPSLAPAGAATQQPLPAGREIGESDEEDILTPEQESELMKRVDRLSSRAKSDTRYSEWVDEAAKKYGVEPDVVAAIITHESAGNANAKNAKSSATGLGQFVNKTWNNIKDRVISDAYAGDVEDGKDYRTDPRAAIFGVAFNAADNAKRLASLKTDKGEPIPVTAENLKVMHFLGSGAGAKVVQAHESGFDRKRMNQFGLPSSVYEANDSWLSPNTSVGEFIRHFSK